MQELKCRWEAANDKMANNNESPSTESELFRIFCMLTNCNVLLPHDNELKIGTNKKGVNSLLSKKTQHSVPRRYIAPISCVLTVVAITPTD